MVSALTGLEEWTMMAIASRATTNSTGVMPFARAADISSGFMSREALAISTVPLIMAAMPVPEPPPVSRDAHFTMQLHISLGPSQSQIDQRVGTNILNGLYGPGGAVLHTRLPRFAGHQRTGQCNRQPGDQQDRSRPDPHLVHIDAVMMRHHTRKPGHCGLKPHP